MITSIRNFALASLTAIAVFGATASAAGLAGLWEFGDGSNIGLATVGPDLTFSGVLPTHSASLVDDAAVSLTGVVTTPAAAATNLMRVDHGIAPNGGGLYVNQYTIVTDIFSPVDSRGSWRTIFQTSPTNANDGDYFIRPTDLIGVGDLTYSTNPINETAWTRLVLTVDLALAGGDVKAYLDGNLHYAHPSDPAVDGRFSLDPNMFFFNDEDGDNAPLNVGLVALYNGSLTPAQVTMLGGAGRPVVNFDAIPEPATFVLLALGAAAFAVRRR